MRSLVPGGPLLLVLCGLLEASGGGRALPRLSDDIPFRVNWPGTEFSLVSALASRSHLPFFRHEAFNPVLSFPSFPFQVLFFFLNLPQAEVSRSLIH